MNLEIKKKLKKYLFLISIFFSILIFSHILYIYLYHDSIEKPIKWWSISEWIIWDFPHLNPLLNSTDYNRNIIYLLYRWLMKYNYEEKKLESDLANCEIRNLLYIECYIKQNQKWSDWKNITTEDIVSTYNVLKNTNINNLASTLLKSTTIEHQEWIIRFSNTIEDINFLQILTIPIVPKDILDNIWNKELYWKFNPIDWIFSWPYIIDTVSYDDSLWIQKLILTKNPYYKEKNILIQRYIFKFFKDQNHLLKHKDNISIFFDLQRIFQETTPRLEKKTYFLNRFTSLFINEDKIKDENLRWFIIENIKVDNILNLLPKQFIKIDNIFNIKEKKENKQTNYNLEQMLKNLWYFKKENLILEIIKDNKSKNEILESKTKVIFSPFNLKYNFLSKDNVLIKWKVENNVENVYINDYKLTWFKPGDTEFYYRLKENFSNIKTWKNTYKVEFEIWNEKKIVDEFYVYYEKDEERLNILKEKVKKELEEKIKKEIKDEDKNKIQEKINSLENNFYYNKNYEKFKLKLYYLDDIKELSIVANSIKTQIETFWIRLDIIPISLKELNEKISNGDKDYDMIIVWIDLWFFDFNIYPYFHSSESKNWYNFSNTRDLNLDILLEELKSQILSLEKRNELKEKINEILNKKNIIKTIYKKGNNVFIDKNIKNLTLQETYSSNLFLYEKILDSYITTEKKVLLEKKWIKDFINFIFKNLKNDWTRKK